MTIADTIVCSTCQQPKLLREMRPEQCKGCEKLRKDAYYVTNRDYIRDRNKRMYARGTTARSRKLALVRAAKEVPCVDCAGSFPFYVMDFDHVNGEKTFGLATAETRTEASILLELQKCVVRCACCHRDKTYEERERNATPTRGAQRRRRLDELKAATPCFDCGRSFKPWQMDFDHVGDKTFALSYMLRSRSWSAVLQELANCVLRCANCHREITHQRRTRSEWRKAAA